LSFKITFLNTESVKTLASRDEAIIWHPYTQHKNMPALLPVHRAEGSYLVDEDGKKYIDAISSWWTNLHGHSHPYIAQKIYEQALQLDHVIFAGCTHEPAVQLAERILPLLPGDQSRVFYSDNGSTAVEVGLKMALQYQKNKGSHHKNRILALKNAYHGDTFGAMSVSERGIFTVAFKDFLFEVIFIQPGSEHILTKEDMDSIAGFIYEPMIQGAGGMAIYEAAWLNQLVCELKQHDVVCIADEVMTGFGRTGHLFASEIIPHKPDIICLSKGLTGGTMPLAITACGKKIFDAFYDDNPLKTLFHGHSYTANPIACAAALASLDLLQKEECMANIEFISQRLQAFAQQYLHNDRVRNARHLGTILAFELAADRKEYLSQVKTGVMKLSMKNGVYLRPLGNTVYIMPPYCITPIQLEKVMGVLEEIIEVMNNK
jgi:adenosylmethionine-8-amino-7-oxononanoate aminotransferase